MSKVFYTMGPKSLNLEDIAKGFNYPIEEALSRKVWFDNPDAMEASTIPGSIGEHNPARYIKVTWEEIPSNG